MRALTVSFGCIARNLTSVGSRNQAALMVPKPPCGGSEAARGYPMTFRWIETPSGPSHSEKGGPLAVEGVARVLLM